MEKQNIKEIKQTNESGTLKKPGEGSYAYYNRPTSASPRRSADLVSTTRSSYSSSPLIERARQLLRKESAAGSSRAEYGARRSTSSDDAVRSYEVAHGASGSQETAQAKSKKKVRPSKLAWYEKRKAHKELKRKVEAGKMQPLEVDEAFKKLAEERTPHKEVETKRKRSTDELAESKESCEASSATSSDIFAQNECGRVLAVIDRMRDDGSVPQDKWHWVEAALASVFMQVLEENPGIPPSCDDAGWHDDRAKLIACSNNRSAMLYKVAIKKIGEVWPGAKLEAVEIFEIPSQARAWVYLPITPSQPDDILKMLRTCNPDIPMNGWAVSKMEEPVGPRRQVLLRLNDECLKPLEKKGAIVYYGFGKVTLKICNRSEEASCSTSQADQSTKLVKIEQEEAVSNDPNECTSGSFCEENQVEERESDEKPIDTKLSLNTRWRN